MITIYLTLQFYEIYKTAHLFLKSTKTLPCNLRFSEDEGGLSYVVRGNNAGSRGGEGGYRSGGGRQSEVADFWDDFNVHDPQSIYADKYSSSQEEHIGGGGGSAYRPHQFKTPDSSWGQRQVRYLKASLIYQILPLNNEEGNCRHDI